MSRVKNLQDCARVFSRRSAILKIVEEKALGTRLTRLIREKNKISLFFVESPVFFHGSPDFPLPGVGRSVSDISARLNKNYLNTKVSPLIEIEFGGLFYVQLYARRSLQLLIERDFSLILTFKFNSVCILVSGIWRQ